MSVYLASFASELVKLSEAKDKERNQGGYLRQVAAAAPFAAATAAADVPKGWVDKSVEQAIKRTPLAQRESPVRAAIGRGVGRLGAGLVTSPVFLSGIKDLRSDDEQVRARGYAKVVGAGAAFSGMKGGIEGGIVGSAKGREHALKKIKGIAGARGIIGLGSAALTARAIAGATKDKKQPGQAQQKKGLWGQYGMPTLVGGALGAGEGAFEEAYTKGLRNVTRRGLLGAAGGRAAAGALGTAALTGLVKKFGPSSKSTNMKKSKPGYQLAPSKKDPTVRRWQKVAAANNSPDMYTDVRQWAQDRNDVEVYRLLQKVNEEGMGERTQSRRSAYYALHDEMQSRGHKLPEPPMREKVEREAKPGQVRAPTPLGNAAVASLAIAPGMVATALMALPPSEKDKILDDALDRVFIKNQMHRVEGAPMAWPDGMPQEIAEEFGIPHSEPVVQLARKGEAQAGITAHEVGHMNPGALRRATIAHPITRVAMQAGALASIAVPLAVLMSAGDGKFATREELERKANLTSTVGTVAAAAQAPGIAEEAVANIKAVRALQSVGDEKALLRVLRQAGPGFATYLAPLLVPVAAAGYLRQKARARE